MNALSQFRAAVRQMLPVFALTAVLFGAGTASAAVFTWAGNNANWNNNASWVNNAQPANGDSVLFTNLGTGTNSTVNLARTLTGITFDATANRTFNLINSGANTTTLGSITNNSGFVQNVSQSISFSTNGTVDTGTAGIRLGSRLTGNATVTKAGSGLLEITNGNNSGYTGTLSVDAGSVKLTSGVDAANVVVNNGATLITANDLSNGGAGSITVNSGGTLSPGEAGGYGAFNVTGNTTLNAGSSTTMGVGSISDFDQVISGGATTFGGALTISMDYIPAVFGTTPQDFTDGDSWALFSSASFAGNFTSVTMTGTFGNVTFTKINDNFWQSQYLGNGQQFNFYVADGNGGVAGTLYAVPEPSTIVFAGIGAAMFGWSTWTRRRAKARRQLIEASIA
jgi:autotransporter-associated beta strand protein